MSSSEESKRGPGRPPNPERRAHVITCARRVFAERGFSGSSLDRVAEATGLRKASLFHHFPSKQALYTAVLHQTVMEVGAFIAASNDGATTWLERLDGLAVSLVDYFASHADAAQLLLRDFVNEGPYTSSDGQPLVRMTLAGAAAFIKSGASEGVFDVTDPERTVLAAAGYILFYFGARMVTDDLLGVKGLEADVVELHRNEVVRYFRRICGVNDSD